jgi:GxxExxY protein
LRHETQKELPINYKGLKLDNGYRIDMLVENSVIVELKTGLKDLFYKIIKVRRTRREWVSSE